MRLMNAAPFGWNEGFGRDLKQPGGMPGRSSVQDSVFFVCGIFSSSNQEEVESVFFAILKGLPGSAIVLLCSSIRLPLHVVGGRQEEPCPGQG